MFYQDLFIIDSQNIEEGRAVFTITLNPLHKIYKGHFPGDGITPGVCILQIACDLFSIIQQQNFVIFSMKSVKFMQLIRPAVTPKVTFEFSYQPADEEGHYEAKCTVSHDQETMTKTTLTFCPEMQFPNS